MGYHQLKLTPSDSEKSTIVTPNGLFQWTVLPMGLTNCSQKFVKTITKVLNVSKEVALVYLDDVIVFGKDFKEHLRNLIMVLTLLYNANIKVHCDKSQLFQPSVSFLGHKISQAGLECAEDKIMAVQNYPIPKSPKECMKVMGFFGYLRKFCKDFGIIAKPIYELTTKTNKSFYWTEEADKAMQTLKNRLTSPPVLTIPQPDDTFTLTIDASKTGIGAILQVKREEILQPVAFASYALKNNRCHIQQQN